ncbi:MAG: putative lipopolysaccharide heptosyltransferase III [Neptuniibacter sp.]
MKILVIKFRHIGDVLLSTPLIESLSLTYPEATIDVAVNDYCESVVAHNPHIKKVISYSRKKGQKRGFWKKLTDELKYLSQFYHQYDLVLNLTEGDRGCLITAISGAKARIGFHKKDSFLFRLAGFTAVTPWLEAIHTVKKDLRLLEHLPEAKESTRVLLGASEEDQASARSLVKRYDLGDDFIVIHPVSRGLYKCWHEQRVASLVDYLMQQRSKKVLLTASPDPVEADMLEKIARLCESSPVVAAGELNLPAYRVLVDLAELYIGIDSAPTHIAASTGTPTIALFGSSKPHIWGPWDNQQGADYEVRDGVQQSGKNTLIAKMDLSKFEIDGYQHPELRIDLDVDEVISEVDRILNN